MTAVTICRSPHKAASYVASRAVELRVRSGKGKAGKSGVVKLGTEPAVHAGVT